MKKSVNEFLKEHLNVSWLRPESALCDAISSYEINKLGLSMVDIDLGSGNGIYSFITAGGRFTEGFDWFIQARASRADKNVFDHFSPGLFKKSFIRKCPDIAYKVAFDKKRVLLEQAKTLDWYNDYIAGDITKPYPLADESVRTVFSNILYWVPEARPVMSELRRILKIGGIFVACLPDPAFIDFCPTYKSHLKKYRWLSRLNRNRAGCMARYYNYADIKELAGRHNFKLIYHKGYWSKEILGFWDIGLRPIIRPLLRMTGCLTEAERLGIKREWVKILMEDLAPVAERETKISAPRGFHLCVLEKQA